MTDPTSTTARPDLAPTRDVVRALNTCIEVCTDGERGYAAAAADVRDPDLRELFLAKSKQRAEFVMALQAAIAKLGSFSENQGTLAGAVHRGWLNVRLAVEGKKEKIVVEEWVQGEDAALTAYAKAFESLPLDTLPGDVKELIRVQLHGLGEGLEEARSYYKKLH